MAAELVPFLGALGGLFAAAFLAATLLPAQSELVLAGLIAVDAAPVAALLGVATLGNVLGSVVNWAIGRGAAGWLARPASPKNTARLARAEGWYGRWGRWSLLLSWAPLVGDLLTLAAGSLREPLPTFLVLVTVAKLGRYVVVVWLAGAVG
jgi:membrane protein YqaA with SNARE-associated domain